MSNDRYVSPLSERYASREMQYIFSPDKKFRTWRKLWIALAETEKELGLHITDEQIAELKEHADDINFDVAKEREKVVRHDVMSHVYAYGVQCPKAKGIIAVEDNKPKAIQKLKEVLGNDPDIKVNSMKTKYPEGAERQLIYANTGRYINSKMLPADAGCIVHNVDTVYSICEAVRQGKPLMQRLVTVTGDAITEPCNYLVRIGTSFAELIEAAGGFLQDPEKIIAGGPMMGKAIYDLNIPVTKSSSAILCMTKDEVSEYEPSNCIRCGRCVEVCPGRVMPNKLATLAEQGDLEEFQKINGMECCECGCCSYVCPAKRHLTQTIAGTRKAILANRKK